QGNLRRRPATVPAIVVETPAFNHRLAVPEGNVRLRPFVSDVNHVTLAGVEEQVVAQLDLASGLFPERRIVPDPKGITAVNSGVVGEQYSLGILRQVLDLQGSLLAIP